MIKWRDFSSKHNSWEPEEHLNANLVASIKKLTENTSEEEHSMEKKLDMESPGASEEIQTQTDLSGNTTYRYGYDRGLEAEKILGKLFNIYV